MNDILSGVVPFIVSPDFLQQAVFHDCDDEAGMVVLRTPVALIRMHQTESGVRKSFRVQGLKDLAEDDTEVRIGLRAREGSLELGPGGKDGGSADSGVELHRILDGWDKFDEKAQMLRVEGLGPALQRGVHGSLGTPRG